MNKFDQIFENALTIVKETNYIRSTFVDNLRLLVKLLKNNDYISPAFDVDEYVKMLDKQPERVKEIVLDTKDQSIPPIKLLVKQDADSESFSVTVIDVKNPSNQKEFQNSMLETIFEDVLNHIKTLSLQAISPEAAVDELPPTEGASAQPGAEESELPKV
jgi:hypothetical protein